jgi:AAA+ ATPase superfamily predicted ATPase
VAFFNRTLELQFLNDQTRDDRAALIVLYGRRRTGKTSLLRHFARDRRSVIFVADQGSRDNQLAAFSQVLLDALGETAMTGTVFPSWETALRFAASKASTEPLFLVMDEFGYLCESDPSLPSVLQRLWDAEIRDSRLHIVLCGSYVSFMEREVLGAKNPLYGRRTGEWLLQPFRFRDAREFFPARTPAEQVTIYGILGGVPAYLERFDPEVDIPTNIQARILSMGTPLYNEPRFLMMEELRDPHVYFSVCHAVAFGKTTPNEIAQTAGLGDRSIAGRYMDTLREMRILERMTPITERNPERTRRGRYRLCDPFFRFWFRFVLPNRSALEAGDPKAVLDSRVMPYLDQHVSIAFEDICRQHLGDLNKADALPARYDRIGSWWRADSEVDVVAVGNDGALLMGECKWSVNPVGTDILDQLLRRRAAVESDLDRKPSSVTFAIWARSGFTPELKRRAAREHVLTFDLSDIVR